MEKEKFVFKHKLKLMDPNIQFLDVQDTKGIRIFGLLILSSVVQFAFKIITKDLEFTFCAKNLEEKKKWLDNMRLARYSAVQAYESSKYQKTPSK
jgi:hypothetical protein